MSENRAKVYVGVDARFDTEGRIMPLSITWEDGRVYGIDRVPVSYTHLTLPTN